MRSFSLEPSTYRLDQGRCQGIVNYEEDGQRIQRALERFKGIKMIRDKNIYNNLSPQGRSKLLEKIEATKGNRNFTPSVERFPRLLRNVEKNRDTEVSAWGTKCR